MKKILYAVAVSAIAAMALAASASSDVPRYQPTATLNVQLQGPNLGKDHTFTITWANPCGVDGAFTGTGHGNATAGGATESITGTLVGNSLTFTAIYSTYIPGYTWTQASFPITWDVAAITTYRNHGQYVKAQGGGSVAAHSCLGRPLPFSWSESGTIDSSALAGTTVVLPDSGTYRIDVSGTYTNDGMNVADAAWLGIPDWSNVQDGYFVAPYFLGLHFGEVQINGFFQNWGVYSPTHAYSLTWPLSGTVNLAVFDGDGTIPVGFGTKVPAWYADNTGMLNYTLTYVGP